MRRLTFLILIIAAVYSGYWFVGANTVRNGAQSAIEDARQSGWDIAYGDLQTIGFPSRFDTTANDLVVTPPDGLWSWKVPFLQVFALSYQPNNVIAAFPPQQSLRIGDETLDIEAADLRGSARVRANTDLSFQTATLEVGATTISSDLGWTIGLQRALFALRATPDMTNAYDVYLEADELVLPADLIRGIDPANQLTDTVQRVVVDSVITFDQPLNRHSKDPLAQSMTLRNASVVWGAIALNAEGVLEIDDVGVPEGRITFKTGQWRDIIDLLVRTGAIDSGIAPTITNVANAMAQGDTLELPVSFQNGFMSIGPLPLGPAPRLR